MRTTTATKPPDHLERLGVDLERAARARVVRLRRRRRIHVGAAAVGVAALMTGIGLAASGVGVFGLLRHEGGRDVRSHVDRSGAYHGPAPGRLACAAVRSDSFTCRIGANGPRRYVPAGRLVERSFVVSPRERLLRSIQRSERRGAMPRRQAVRLRRLVSATGEEFFRALDRMPLLDALDLRLPAASEAPLVPPRGVPMLVFCDVVRDSSATCHPLAGAVAVPGRAPFYRLLPGPDWRRLPVSRLQRSNAYGWHAELILGRLLAPAEVRLVRQLAVPLEASSSSGSGSGSGSSSGGFSSP